MFVHDYGGLVVSLQCVRGGAQFASQCPDRWEVMIGCIKVKPPIVPRYKLICPSLAVLLCPVVVSCCCII